MTDFEDDYSVFLGKTQEEITKICKTRGIIWYRFPLEYGIITCDHIPGRLTFTMRDGKCIECTMEKP